MSRIKLSKLSLNKKTITKLQESQMIDLRGGARAKAFTSCGNDSCGLTCVNTSCNNQ